MYFAALILTLGVHLPLSPFVRRVLSFYRLVPTQIGPGSWRVVLGFEALCAHQRVVFGIDEFRSIYQMKLPKDKPGYFSPRTGADKLILGIGDSDSGWRENVVHVTEPWESNISSEQGTIRREWNPLGTGFSNLQCLFTATSRPLLDYSFHLF